jgi:hypothetical protein
MNIDRTNKLDDIYLGIISRRRPESIEQPIYSNLKFCFKHEQINWYVSDKQDVMEYSDHHANVINSGGLIESRNRIINDAHHIGYNYCCIIEDDLISIKIAHDKKNVTPITLDEAIENMYNTLCEINHRLNIKMIGVAPTSNPYFYNPYEPISFNKFCIGSLLLIKTDTECRFDYNLKLKEDYDFTLQNINKYGGAARANYILANFQHYKNRGGAVDYRTVELEQKTIIYLKQKWGNAIRNNPRRKNEILLNVKK